MNSLIRWRSLLPEVRRRLRRHAGVVGVGLGVRTGARRPTGLVWRVYVTGGKLTPSGRNARKIPTSIFGLGTELISSRPGRPNAGKEYTAGVFVESKIKDSLFRSGPSEQGALGCFARYTPTNEPVLLTNSHVMFPAFIATPHLGMYQPDYSSCCSGGDRIATAHFDPAQVKDGKYKGGFKTVLGRYKIPAPAGNGYTMSSNTMTCTETDCAIASLVPGVKFKNVLPVPAAQGGPIAIDGANTNFLDLLGPEAGTAPSWDQYVRVYSPRDGGKLIYGTILYRDTDEPGVDAVKIYENTPDERLVTPIFNYGFVDQSAEHMEAKGALPLINQLVILPRPAPKPGINDYTKLYGQPNQNLSFDHGDSGSVVIDHAGRVIGQVVGGFPFSPDFVHKPSEKTLIEFTSVGNVAIVSPIRGIIELLNIRIPTGGWSETVPNKGARIVVPGLPEDPAEASGRHEVERLKTELRTSLRGKLLLGKIAQHRGEVRRMVAAVRAVGAAWQELNGSRFYYHCVRSARDPNHTIPTCINGVTRERLAEVMLPLVARHASPGLRQDIERFGLRLLVALIQVSTIREVPSALVRRGCPV